MGLCTIAGTPAVELENQLTLVQLQKLVVEVSNDSFMNNVCTCMNKTYACDVMMLQTVKNSTFGMEMYAYGHRNPLGLIYSTKDLLYTVDNGPNADSGPALLGIDKFSPNNVGTNYDRLDINTRFSYHGIGNANRARQGDLRQARYIAREPSDPYYQPSFSYVDATTGIAMNYTEPVGLVASSSDGSDEYRSNAFLGAMRGWLIVSKLATFTYFVQLSSDGTTVYNIAKDSVSI